MKTLLTHAMWLIVLVYAPYTQAATLISFLNQPTANWDGLNDSSFRHAVDFHTSGSSFVITSATLGLFSDDNVTHTMTVSLYTDSLGSPGSQVGVFDTSISIAPTGLDLGQVYTVTDSGMTLAANTTYWLVLQMNQNHGPGTVYFTNATGSTPDAGSMFSPVAETRNFYSSDSGTTWGTTLKGNFRYSLEGFAAPEPGRTTMLLAGLSTLLLRRRR